MSKIVMVDKKGRWWVGLLAAGAVFGAAGLAQAAAPVVKTVPWVAQNPLIPHDTWAGKTVTLKGTCDSQGGNFTYFWDFGDGSPLLSGTVANKYAIQATHAYSGPVGTVYTARLTVQNTSTGETGFKEYYVAIRSKSLAVETNVAIDEGLWALHKSQTRSTQNGVDHGSWAATSYYSLHAANVNAFLVNGHAEGGGTSNPYTETVTRAMSTLFTLLTTQAISSQLYPVVLTGTNPPSATVNPDLNGNGLGIRPNDRYPPYQGGMFMDAIVATGTPDKLTSTGGVNIIGRKYKDIVQDMVDYYAFAQGDDGTYYGGWHYNPNSTTTDNSTNQWAAIGLIAAEQIIDKGLDGILGTSDDVRWAVVPQWLKAANRNSIAQSQHSVNGNFGYNNTPGSSAWGQQATTPSGAVQMVMDGIGRGDDSGRWEATENYLRNVFCNPLNWGPGSAIRAYYYGLFSFTKAMLLHDPNGDGIPEKIDLLSNWAGSPKVASNQLDWYSAEAAKGAACDGVARILVNQQSADGTWSGHNVSSEQYYFETAWAIIMLNKTVFESGLPVAVANAVPNPAIMNQLVTLNGASSYHQDTSKSIVSWEWDLDNNGTFETVGLTASVSFDSLGEHPVKLRVTDNGSPARTAETTLVVNVNTPPIAPTARAGGPYNFCENRAPWFLDGRGSVNPDDGQHAPGRPGDFIKSYEWSLGGNVFASVALPDTTVYFTGKGPGDYIVTLKVTDNSADSFGLGADLSGIDTAQVRVREAADPVCASCPTNVSARAKPGKAELSWTDAVGPHHYNIYRGTVNGGPYVKVAEAGGTSRFYLDQGLTNGTTYYWVIREAAVNGEEACQSNQASARPVATR